MNTVDRSPARLSSWVAVSVGFVALGSSGLYSWSALAVGTVGFVMLVVGIVRGESTGVTTGAFILFSAAIIGGVRGVSALPVLISATTAVLAWDIGGSAISIGNQLGRDADTTRIESVHVTASLSVGLVTVGGGYGIYQIGTGSRPVAALVFLLIAAVLLVEALD